MKILYYILQWTWGLPQNILALLLKFFLLIKDPDRKCRRYHCADLIYWKREYSMGLGMFIFFGHSDDPDAAKILVHEYGHTIQSAILGPLFLPLVGIPSAVWAMFPAFKEKRRAGKSFYYDFYPEKNANRLGEKALHEDAPGNKKTADDKNSNV